VDEFWLWRCFSSVHPILDALTNSLSSSDHLRVRIIRGCSKTPIFFNLSFQRALFVAGVQNRSRRVFSSVKPARSLSLAVYGTIEPYILCHSWLCAEAPLLSPRYKVPRTPLLSVVSPCRLSIVPESHNGIPSAPPSCRRWYTHWCTHWCTMHLTMLLTMYPPTVRLIIPRASLQQRRQQQQQRYHQHVR
jgi:hypothetical protein